MTGLRRLGRRARDRTIMIEQIAKKVRDGGRVDAAEALELYRHAPTHLLGSLADGIRARKHPERYRHLHHRPQRQLHERVRGALQLLRVLPPGRVRRRLRARVRGDLPEDRRDDCRRRQPAAAAGRSQSRPADRLVRGSVPRRQVALSGIQAARAVAAGSAAHREAESADAAAGDRAPRRRRSRQHSGRRCRNPRRSRPQAAQLLQQGLVRRMARRHARRASRRPANDGDDDVRDGRDGRGAHRAHDAAARRAGRDRRLHRVHHLELPARTHGARRRTLPRRRASTTSARWRSRASSSTTSTTCRRRG